MKKTGFSVVICIVGIIGTLLSCVGCGKQAPQTDGIDDRVYKLEFSKYDWTETYLTYAQCDGWSDFVPQLGDKVTISFDYCTTGSTEMRFFNRNTLSDSFPISQKWTNNSTYWFEELSPQDGEPRVGHFEWTFTAEESDVQDRFGKPRPLCWRWQQIDQSGGEEPVLHDFYYWNFKVTVNDSDENVIKKATYQTDSVYESVVDIDPSTITPESLAKK